MPSKFHWRDRCKDDRTGQMSRICHITTYTPTVMTSWWCNVHKAHRIPHNNDDVITERPIDVLRGIQIEVVTIVMIETRACRYMYVAHHKVTKKLVQIATEVPMSSLMKTVGLVIIWSQCFLEVGLKSSSVNCSSSANQLWSGDLCSPCCRWSSCLNWQCPPTSPSRKKSSRNLMNATRLATAGTCILW